MRNNEISQLIPTIMANKDEYNRPIINDVTIYSSATVEK